MLTLLRGKAKKSEYFAMLYNGYYNGILIQYGQNVPMMLYNGKESWIVDRKDITKTNMFELEMELNEILENVLTTNFQILFLYANFSPQEVEVLKNILQEKHIYIDVFVSVQDNSVPGGQLIIQEIRI